MNTVPTKPVWYMWLDWSAFVLLGAAQIFVCCLEAVWEGRATSAMEWYFILRFPNNYRILKSPNKFKHPFWKEN